MKERIAATVARLRTPDSGGTLTVPDGLDAKYKVILFYRGHW